MDFAEVAGLVIVPGAGAGHASRHSNGPRLGLVTVSPRLGYYLNDEVVPAVRTHSTRALRVASQKLSEFADYMEQHRTQPK